MNLTKHADYSIRVLMHLARRPGEKVSITTIADTYGISRNHLMKVSQNLARHGYIVGYRGKGGGIALARPARNINLSHVLQRVEQGLKPLPATDNAPDSTDGSDADAADPLRRALGEARSAYLGALAAYSLADLIVAPGPSAGTVALRREA